MRKTAFRKFLEAYIKCALWSSTDEEEVPLDSTEFVLSKEAVRDMIRDCRKFFTEQKALISADFSLAGHDFWLTRNGHGAGFWDGDWPEENGEKLTEASKKFGESYLYILNGLIYVQ